MRKYFWSWAFWASTTAAALTLVLAVANAVLLSGNRATQADVNERQQFINQTVQLSRVNNGLIRALAESAVANKDDKLRDILTQAGVTVTAPTGTETAPAADSKKGH